MASKNRKLNDLRALVESLGNAVAVFIKTVAFGKSG
jgi:hypothetical protein